MNAREGLIFGVLGLLQGQEWSAGRRLIAAAARRWGAFTALEREKKFKFYRGTPTLGPYAGSRARNIQHFSSSVCTGNSERNEPPNSGSNSTNVARFNGGRNEEV